MLKTIVLFIAACLVFAMSLTSCSAYKAPSPAQHDDLQSVLDEYLRDEARRRHWRVLDTQVTWASEAATRDEIAAVFRIATVHRIDYKRAEDTPALKGRLRFMRDHEAELSASQLERARENIESWRRDLNEYITKDQQAFSIIKVTGKLDAQGRLIRDSVDYYIEGDGPDGKGIAYYPYNSDDIPTSQEVERDSYEGMKEIVGFARD